MRFQGKYEVLVISTDYIWLQRIMGNPRILSCYQDGQGYLHPEQAECLEQIYPGCYVMIYERAECVMIGRFYYSSYLLKLCDPPPIRSTSLNWFKDGF